jgi:hypothetical protein
MAVNHKKFKRYLIGGKTTRQLSELHGVCIATIRSRIAAGWDESDMLNGYRKYNKPAFDGLTAKQISVKQGVRFDTVRKRKARGWTTQQIAAPWLRQRGYLIKINNEIKTLKELSNDYCISLKVLRDRLKNFYRIEDAIRASKNHRKVCISEKQ